jgi:hypothetical protein
MTNGLTPRVIQDSEATKHTQRSLDTLKSPPFQMVMGI